jgi:hypothetical protein
VGFRNDCGLVKVARSGFLGRKPRGSRRLKDGTSDWIDIWESNRLPAQDRIQGLLEIPLCGRRTPFAEIDIPVIDPAAVNQLSDLIQ